MDNLVEEAVEVTEEEVFNFDQPEDLVEEPEEEQNVEDYPTEEELFAECESDSEPEPDLLMAQYTAFAVRTKKPTKKDKFAKCYIKKSAGWSTACLGKPKDADCNVLANCVGYAQGRFCEIYNEIMGTTGNKYSAFSCNAKNFVAKAKSVYPELVISDKPQPGAILCMGHKTKAGHVMIVEKVNADGSIYTSESSYGGKAFYNKTRKYSDGHWGMDKAYYQVGFILNPAIKEYPDLVQPVERSIHVDQVQAKVASLRVRYEPNLKGKILGHTVKDAFYNYYDTVESDGYTWFEISEDSQWCANDGSLVVLPAVKDPQVGDHVILSGPLYRSSAATKPSGSVKNKDTHVTRFVEGALHPYNTTGNLGWCDASSLTVLDPLATKYKVAVPESEDVKIEVDKKEAQPGEVVQLDVTPKDGVEIEEITVNGEVVEDNAFIMPDEDAAITVVTEPKKYLILCEPNLHGEVTVEKLEALPGEFVRIFCKPESHYKVASVGVSSVMMTSEPYYNADGSIGFNMPEDDVIVSAVFEKISNSKFIVGDKVRILRAGNTLSDGGGRTVFMIGSNGTISRVIWKAEFELAEFCYQLQAWDGTPIGFFREEDLALVDEYVPHEFNIGDHVKIKGKGNSRSDGSGYTVFGIGWKKEVLDFLPNEEFPYKVGKAGLVNVVQGYYKEIDLEEV